MEKHSASPPAIRIQYHIGRKLVIRGWKRFLIGGASPYWALEVVHYSADASTTLLATGLPPDSTIDSCKSMFEPYGEVKRVKIHQARDSAASAYVEMAEMDDAIKVVTGYSRKASDRLANEDSIPTSGLSVEFSAPMDALSKSVLFNFESQNAAVSFLQQLLHIFENPITEIHLGPSWLVPETDAEDENRPSLEEFISDVSCCTEGPSTQ